MATITVNSDLHDLCMISRLFSYVFFTTFPSTIAFAGSCLIIRLEAHPLLAKKSMPHCGNARSREGCLQHLQCRRPQQGPATTEKLYWPCGRAKNGPCSSCLTTPATPMQFCSMPLHGLNFPNGEYRFEMQVAFCRRSPRGLKRLFSGRP